MNKYGWGREGGAEEASEMHEPRKSSDSKSSIQVLFLGSCISLASSAPPPFPKGVGILLDEWATAAWREAGEEWKVVS